VVGFVYCLLIATSDSLRLNFFEWRLYDLLCGSLVR